MFLASATAAHAGVVRIFTDRASFDAAFPGSVAEDWDGFMADVTIPDGETVNGITYNTSAINEVALITDNFATTTGSNGLGQTPIALQFFPPTDTVTFGFGAPLTAFGIDISTFGSSDGDYSATTDDGDVVLSFFDPFPLENTGQFIGFETDTPFNEVTIMALTGDEYTLDTLRAVQDSIPGPAPEPATLALLALGLAGLGFATRRVH